MIMKLKICSAKRPPQLGTFSSHSHPFVKFVWEDIIERNLELSSVARAAGIDRSTLHKWRKSPKGPSVGQIQEVLTALGYELKIIKSQSENK